MKDYIEDRILEEAKYIIRTKSTVRDTAKIFCVCKSTVHRDMTERLPKINPNVASQVRGVLDFNLDERHIRGGRATSMKYRRGVQ